MTSGGNTSLGDVRVFLAAVSVSCNLVTGFVAPWLLLGMSSRRTSTAFSSSAPSVHSSSPFLAGFMAKALILVAINAGWAFCCAVIQSILADLLGTSQNLFHGLSLKFILADSLLGIPLIWLGNSLSAGLFAMVESSSLQLKSTEENSTSTESATNEENVSFFSSGLYPSNATKMPFLTPNTTGHIQRNTIHTTSISSMLSMLLFASIAAVAPFACFLGFLGPLISANNNWTLTTAPLMISTAGVSCSTILWHACINLLLTIGLSAVSSILGLLVQLKCCCRQQNGWHWYGMLSGVMVGLYAFGYVAWHASNIACIGCHFGSGSSIGVNGSIEGVKGYGSTNIAGVSSVSSLFVGSYLLNWTMPLGVVAVLLGSTNYLANRLALSLLYVNPKAD